MFSSSVVGVVQLLKGWRGWLILTNVDVRTKTTQQRQLMTLIPTPVTPVLLHLIFYDTDSVYKKSKYSNKAKAWEEDWLIVSLWVMCRSVRPPRTIHGARPRLSCQRSLTWPLTWWRLLRSWAWCGNASMTAARTGDMFIRWTNEKDNFTELEPSSHEKYWPKSKAQVKLREM